MTDWREGYQAALRAFMLDKGQPMLMTEDRWTPGRFEPSYYGWVDYDAWEHFAKYRDEKCTAVIRPEDEALVTLTEEHYSQFQDTFYTGDTQKSFLVLHPVSCACGRYTDMFWGYEGSMSDIILGLVGYGD